MRDSWKGIENVAKSELIQLEEPLKICPEVMIFAEAMERKLRENAHKGDWRDCEETYLDERIDQELDEFREALGRGDNVLGEGADVANFIMMLCDISGNL